MSTPRRGAVVVAAGTLPAGAPRDRRRALPARRPAAHAGSRVLVKHGTATVQAIVRRSSRATTSTASRTSRPTALRTNDIGRARLRLSADLPLEPYDSSRHGGSFLVIHPSDGATLAAGIVRD